MKKDSFLKTFILLISTLVFLAVALTTFWSSFLSSTKQETESYVLAKQSEKSLFFRPLYSVITTDNKYGNYVTKKTFDKLEYGDTISGYSTKEHSFFTMYDYIYTSIFVVPLILLLAFLAIVLSINLVMRIPFFDGFFDKWTNFNWLKFSFLTVYFLFALIYVCLFSLNIFHKVIPINQTKVEASIVDTDFYEKKTEQGDHSYYNLTLEFMDSNGDTYRVVKGVSEITYSKYEYEKTINIKYRNKNPYDIFIATWSIFEILSAFESSKVALYFLFIISIALIYIFYVHHFLFDRPKKKRKRSVKN